MRTLLLDNEPVQALLDRAHPKHLRALDLMQVAVQRRRQGPPLRVVVPTAVRVEAGWDRAQPKAAVLNRFPVSDMPLGSREANEAASIVRDHGVSIADAHCGVVLRALVGTDVVVLTSDPHDMKLVAIPTVIRTVRL